MAHQQQRRLVRQLWGLASQRALLAGHEALHVRCCSHSNTIVLPISGTIRSSITTTCVPDTRRSAPLWLKQPATQAPACRPPNAREMSSVISGSGVKSCLSDLQGSVTEPGGCRIARKHPLYWKLYGHAPCSWRAYAEGGNGGGLDREKSHLQGPNVLSMVDLDQEMNRVSHLRPPSFEVGQYIWYLL